MKILTSFSLNIFIALTLQAQSTDLTFLKDGEYAITYSSDWELDTTGQMGTSFILFGSSNLSNQFRQNINLIVQDLAGMDFELDAYIESSKSELKKMLMNYHLIRSKKIELNGKSFYKMIYTAEHGELKLKFEQYYFINRRKAYVLTFTSLVNEFDKGQLLAEKIMNSFKFI